MAKKTQYPGGFKLTAKTARAVAVQEFGTAKGLEKEDPAPRNYFVMQLGNLTASIYTDEFRGKGRIVVSCEISGGTGKSLIILDPETLKEDFATLTEYEREISRDRLEDWVNTNGPEYCTAEVNRIWDRG